jgi:hypothetical protein
MTLLTEGVLLISAIGIVGGGAVALRTRSVYRGLRAMLELWTAATLLRLSEERSWTAIAGAAAIVLLRQVVGIAVARSRR